MNRGNVLGLESVENLFRVTSSARATRGPITARVSALVERTTGAKDDSRFEVRQAYFDYKTDDGFLARIGRQRVSWGSGLVWNPTARLEPPKSPTNPSTERPGIDAVRLDVSPSASASVTLVAGRGRTTLTDLPGALETDREAAWTGALRSRLVFGATDVAVTFLAGEERAGLVGLDLGRTVGAVALHAETALYRGSEIGLGTPRDFHVRSVIGGLWTPGDTSVSFEYFFNGEGMSAPEFSAYLDRLDRNLTLSQDPRVDALTRAAAFAAWGRDAALPFSGNLGLRRHYASIALSRRELVGDVGVNLRVLRGIADDGLILTPGLSYAPPGHLQFTFDAVLLLGPEDSEYRLAPIERAFQAKVKWTF